MKYTLRNEKQSFHPNAFKDDRATFIAKWSKKLWQKVEPAVREQYLGEIWDSENPSLVVQEARPLDIDPETDKIYDDMVAAANEAGLNIKRRSKKNEPKTDTETPTELQPGNGSGGDSQQDA